MFRGNSLFKNLSNPLASKDFIYNAKFNCVSFFISGNSSNKISVNATTSGWLKDFFSNSLTSF